MEDGGRTTTDFPQILLCRSRESRRENISEHLCFLAKVHGMVCEDANKKKTSQIGVEREERREKTNLLVSRAKGLATVVESVTLGDISSREPSVASGLLSSRTYKGLQEGGEEVSSSLEARKTRRVENSPCLHSVYRRYVVRVDKRSDGRRTRDHIL